MNVICTPPSTSNAGGSQFSPIGPRRPSSRSTTSPTVAHANPSAVIASPAARPRRIGSFENEIMPFAAKSSRPRNRAFDIPLLRPRQVNGMPVERKPHAAIMPRRYG